MIWMCGEIELAREPVVGREFPDAGFTAPEPRQKKFPSAGFCDFARSRIRDLRFSPLLRVNYNRTVDVLIARNSEDFETAFQKLAAADALGCDTETSGLSARHGRLYSIQFSDGKFNVLIPLSEGIGLGRFADILMDERIVKIFHNAKFDLEFLNENDHGVRNIFDTMIAEKVLTRGAHQSASLADTLYRYFAVDLDKSQRAKFTRKWDGIWTDELVDYALSDVVHLPRLMQEQTAWLQKLGLFTEFKQKMKPVISIAQIVSIYQ